MSEVVHHSDEVEFEVFGRKITGKQWGRSDGIPTLGLHGWLDNANTFDRLAPLLPELKLIALDFAGHGLSDHRPAGVHYHSLTDIQDVLSVAGLLGWTTFDLIGHSMGAAVSSELAGLFPERVNRAVMIDGFIATGGVTLQERLEQNRTAVEKMLNAHTSAPKLYSDIETMARRVTEATDQSFDAAFTLVQRGHKVVDSGVTWRTDPRIRFPTPLRYTREYIDLLLQDATAPALLLVAEQGDTWYQGEIDAAQTNYANLTVQCMQGPHHIHLEPRYVREVARHTRAFYGFEPLAQDVAQQMEWDGSVS